MRILPSLQEGCSHTQPFLRPTNVPNNTYTTPPFAIHRPADQPKLPPNTPFPTPNSFCGSLCCADCTRFRLGAQQKRACMLCHLAVQRARREYEETGGGGPGELPSSQATSPGSGSMGGGYGLGSDYGTDMTERMLTLESRLGHMERQRRVRKARTLLQCADWAARAQTLSLVLAGGLLGHALAGLAAGEGWDARAVAWLQAQAPGAGPAVGPALQWLGGLDPYWVVLGLGVVAAGAVAATTLYRRSVTAFSVVRCAWMDGWMGVGKGVGGGGGELMPLRVLFFFFGCVWWAGRKDGWWRVACSMHENHRRTNPQRRRPSTCVFVCVCIDGLMHGQRSKALSTPPPPPHTHTDVHARTL